MVWDVGTTVYFGRRHRIRLVESSSGQLLSTTPANPLAMYESLSSDNRGLDILVLSSIEYLYFFRYAPPSVVSHLYFGSPTDDLFLEAYERLGKGAQIDLKATTFDPFLATHDKFLVYGRGNSEDAGAIQTFVSAGYTMKSARADTNGVFGTSTKRGCELLCAPPPRPAGGENSNTLRHPCVEPALGLGNIVGRGTGRRSERFCPAVSVRPSMFFHA